MEHKIVRVEPGSIAEEMEIEAGDVLLSVDGQEIEDIFDFQTLVADEEFTLLIRKPDGEEWELDIEKDEEEELGIVFESDLMSDYRSCSNACIFCFIDQMPKGMRDTLYFKDDDSRLSFLQGNYITLTNMKQKDVDRIIRYHLEPMNISVQATEPELRCQLLHNRFAGDVLRYLDDFYRAGLHMNAQVVLVRDVNDKAHLERTISDLYRYAPVLQSVSVVPVGLTKFREGLYPIQPFDAESAAETVDLIEKWQKKAFSEFGIHFVHASDELYLLSGRDFPEEERYDDYLQLENGVGMARLLFTEADAEIDRLKADAEIDKLKAREHEITEEHEITGKCEPKAAQLSFATGRLAAPLLEAVRAKILQSGIISGAEESLPIYAIRNDFFGETVTVAGLITGRDLIDQLKGQPLGSVLYLPSCMFKSGENVFLDDVTREDAEKELHVKIRVLKSGGGALVRAMTGNLRSDDLDTTHGKYEL